MGFLKKYNKYYFIITNQLLLHAVNMFAILLIRLIIQFYFKKKIFINNEILVLLKFDEF